MSFFWRWIVSAVVLLLSTNRLASSCSSANSSQPSTAGTFSNSSSPVGFQNLNRDRPHSLTSSSPLTSDRAQDDLNLACRTGDLQGVKRAVKKGADIFHKAWGGILL